VGIIKRSIDQGDLQAGREYARRWLDETFKLIDQVYVSSLEVHPTREEFHRA
jgi:hypothetical protein